MDGLSITLITGPANAGKAQLAMDAVRRHIARGEEPLFQSHMFDGSALVLISVSIDEGFDQTPGPTAGHRL